MQGNSHKKRKKVMMKDFYTELKRRERLEQKEYMTFLKRLTMQAALPGDLAGEMLVSLPGRCLVVVRNFCAVSEYTAERIRVRSKRYEMCIEGRFLRFSYYLPEELLITGDIHSLSFPRSEHT